MVIVISCFKDDWPDFSGLFGIYTRVNRHVVLSLISSSLSIFPVHRQITQRASVASLALRQTRWIKAPWASSIRAKQRSMNPRKVGIVAPNMYLCSLYLGTHTFMSVQTLSEPTECSECPVKFSMDDLNNSPTKHWAETTSSSQMDI